MYHFLYHNYNYKEYDDVKLVGYFGKDCENEFNECESQPCYFGGTCIDLVGRYRCECADGFIGERCEAVIRQCPFTNPCGENAVCVEKPRGKLLKLHAECNVIIIKY